MMKGILERIVRRVSTQQRANLTRTIARRLRNTHARILLAQKRGMALRMVAEQAYQDVQAEMERQLGIEPQGAVSLVLAGE
ncbi:MAG: hypothetical protein NTU41_09285 [Chloroflexi bacterium]|nr:hypothetical protein [Chloroflexota bacterium]